MLYFPSWRPFNLNGPLNLPLRQPSGDSLKGYGIGAAG